MNIVKDVISGISKPLTHIFNFSLQTSQFPNKTKIAKVIPLFKGGEKHRPVSLLPQFSKMLEKVFNNRLDNFIETHNLEITQNLEIMNAIDNNSQ